MLLFTINQCSVMEVKIKSNKAAYFRSDNDKQALNRFVVKNETLHDLLDTHHEEESPFTSKSFQE